MQDGEEPIAVGMHLVLAGKSLERIGDHATNIAEEVCFMVTGRVLQRRVTSLSQADRAAT
jgi:phosphate transport system protein